MTAEVTMRPLTADDADLLKLALYLAVAWNPEGSYPPYSPELLDHPELALPSLHSAGPQRHIRVLEPWVRGLVIPRAPSVIYEF